MIIDVRRHGLNGQMSNDQIFSVVTTVASVILGGVITWAAAWHYYKRAGDELRGEAKELRKLISMVLTAMERQGSAKLNRDAEGNIVGFVFEYEGSGGLSFHGSLDRKFIPGSANKKANE